MQPPAITRHRRPFLAPFWVMWLLFFLLVAAAFVAYRSATTTTIVLVRHAEKATVTIDDPPLSAEGEQRADRLAHLFGDVEAGRLDAIYVTDTKRTQQTAGPLAARLGITPTVLPATDVSGAARRVLRDHRGGRALLVGHSNTVPDIVRKLSGRDVPEMSDDDYGTVYVVTVPSFGRSSVLSLKY